MHKEYSFEELVTLSSASDLTQLFTNIEIIDKSIALASLGANDEESQVISNVFDVYGPCPSAKLSNVNAFYAIIGPNGSDSSDDESSDSDSEESSESSHKRVPFDRKIVETLVEGDIRTIITEITYPLSQSAIFKFTAKQPVTYGMLLYAYTIAYQLVYKIEELDDKDPGYIPNMFNRSGSAGRFGIWGHYIDDLIYNGYSTIKIYSGKHSNGSVLCYFSCDS